LVEGVEELAADIECAKEILLMKFWIAARRMFINLENPY